MKSLLLLLMVGFVGCTDATRAHLSQLNNPADVICYSGGQVVFHGVSTGKVTSNSEEDGLYFMDRETGKFVRIYADCIVKSL